MSEQHNFGMQNRSDEVGLVIGADLDGTSMVSNPTMPKKKKKKKVKKNNVEEANKIQQELEKVQKEAEKEKDYDFNFGSNFD